MSENAQMTMARFNRIGRQVAGFCRGAAVVLLAMTAALGASAQQAPSLADASLAATCLGCHPRAGARIDGDALPSLDGRPAADLLRRLEAWRADRADTGVMAQLARGYTEAQLARIAAYFAAQPAARP